VPRNNGRSRSDEDETNLDIERRAFVAWARGALRI